MGHWEEFSYNTDMFQNTVPISMSKEEEQYVTLHQIKNSFLFPFFPTDVFLLKVWQMCAEYGLGNRSWTGDYLTLGQVAV